LQPNHSMRNEEGVQDDKGQDEDEEEDASDDDDLETLNNLR